MKKTSHFISMLLAFVLCLTLVACGSAEPSKNAPESATPSTSNTQDKQEVSQPITLKVASQDTAESLAGQLLTSFKTAVEKESNGSITVDLHFSGTLGSLNDMVEGVSMGTIDMATAGIGSFQSYCDNMMIFDNYLVGTTEGFLAIWESEVGQQVLNQLCEEAGIRAIGYNLCGVGHVEYWTSKDYATIESLKNVNLRTNGTKTVNLACEAIGAVAVPVSNAEQYNAFQTGMIDAMSLDAANMMDMGFLQDGMYELDIIDNYLATAFVISQSTWEKLSSEQQEILLACAKTYSDTSGEQYADKLSNTAARLKEYDVPLCSISAEDIAELNKMVTATLGEYYGEFCDPDVLAQAMAVLGK